MWFSYHVAYIDQCHTDPRPDPGNEKLFINGGLSNIILKLLLSKIKDSFQSWLSER
jgi:hypothetical protein